MRRRGLDLPEWLAGPGAQRLFIRKIGRRQQGLGEAERKRNAKRHLVLSGNRIPHDHMVLIDDVRTTGATTLAGASLLVAKGIRVSIVTLAGVGRP